MWARHSPKTSASGRGRMTSGLGFLLIVLFAFLGAAVLYGIHRVARPHADTGKPVSDALRELEPRGGRHRYSVRLFEAMMLVTIWLTGLAALTLWAPIAKQSSASGFGAAATLAAVLLLITWWSWRRGTFRTPQPRPKSIPGRYGDSP